MRVRANVTATEPGWAEVQVDRHAACAGCGACGLHEEKGSFRVADPLGVHVGDEVVVHMRPKSFLKIALLVYAVPLAAMMAGLLVGAVIVGGNGIGREMKVLVFGLVFMGAAIATTWHWQRHGGGAGLSPRLEKIVEADAERDR